MIPGQKKPQNECRWAVSEVENRKGGIRISSLSYDLWLLLKVSISTGNGKESWEGLYDLGCVTVNFQEEAFGTAEKDRWHHRCAPNTPNFWTHRPWSHIQLNQPFEMLYSAVWDLPIHIHFLLSSLHTSEAWNQSGTGERSIKVERSWPCRVNSAQPFRAVWYI